MSIKKFLVAATFIKIIYGLTCNFKERAAFLVIK